MNLLSSLRRRPLAFGSSLALVAFLACTSSNPGGGQDAGGDSGLPQCTSTQACVGYPSFGDWVCLQSCTVAANDCPSGTSCTVVSGCCSGGGCSAAAHDVCVPNADAGDAAPDAPQPDADAGDAAPDAPSDAQPDADAGFPQCTSTQACVGYPSFADWVCLQSCTVDAGECPPGTTCTTLGGCCSGAGCSAVADKVCVPNPDGGDAATDAPSDAKPDDGG